MDFNLKQWREQVQQQQHESEEHQEQAPSAKIPRHPLPPPTPLSLFITEPTTIKTTKNDMSASSSDSTPTIFPRVGSYFSLSQWQELELQALIFRHMLAGAAIPVELLYLVKKSLINTNPYYFTHPLQHFPHFNPSLMQSSGYWGKGAMDPEPTRCRRTDGKKWRCSRDVVDGHKYCERHVHRGRNRSRKPVEIPTPPPPTSSSSSVVSGLLKFSHAQPIASVGATDALVSVSGPSPSFDLLRFGNSENVVCGRSSSTVKNEENKSEVDKSSGDKNKTLLRHFFDDWSRPPIQESENTISISTPTMPSVSDVSLKLSTGVVGTGGTEGGGGQRQPEESHGGGSGGGRGTWGASNQMGGPLAEALRSSTSNSSPTSVLHH